MIFFFFPWASSGHDCCTLGEVVHSAQAKQTGLESGNTFIVSLWTSSVNSSRAGRCSAFSSSLSFFLGKSFQSKSKEVRHTLSGISAQNSPFPCWCTDHSHLTSPKLSGWAGMSVFSPPSLYCLVFPAHIPDFNLFCLADTFCPLCRHWGCEAMSNYPLSILLVQTPAHSVPRS